MLRGVRGATTVDKNEIDDIRNSVIEMVNEILVQNNIETDTIACAEFTMTKDLNCAYPAKFAREISGFEKVPLMCYQELDIDNSLQKCIRVLILFNTDKTQDEIKHIYLRNAKALRPDLTK